jgi:rhodanese-related sulfurtransferase
MERELAMTARHISSELAWRETEETGRPILDLRTRAERRKFGYPPGSVKVSLLRHALVPVRDGIYLCQHAVRSKLPASRGAREIEGGFVAWKRNGQPLEGGA